jgi:Ca2+-transporting ATPase
VIAEGAVRGLRSTEAAARLARDGYNELPSPDRRGFLRVIAEVAREPMFLLLVAGGVVYVLLGDRVDALLLVAFAGLSIVITIVQSVRSERVLETLRNLASPRALVIRDGQRIHVAGREVVRDDVMVITEGDRVPADAVVLSAEELMVDESLLTGESVPVHKLASAVAVGAAPGDVPALALSEACRVFAGTLVVRGTAVALVHATGLHSEMGRIGHSLRTIEPGQPHLQQQMAWLVRDFAIVGAIAGGLAVLLFGLLRGQWLEAMLGGIALGMSLLPEEFPLVMAVFMAMGAWRISQARVLTRRAAAIETLGATTVLCTDKTGTLTENRMRAATVISAGVRWDPQDGLPASAQVQATVRAALLACPREPIDPMDIAVHALAREGLRESAALAPGMAVVRAYGLRPDLLAVTNVVSAGGQGAATAYAKGAPEAIFAMCRLPAGETERLHLEVEALAREGIRVLAIARTALLEAAQAAHLPESPRALDFQFLGLVGFSDPLRRNVPAAVAECRSAGIRVVMITGDFPATAIAIARQAGLEASSVLTGDELEAMSEAQFAVCAKSVSIFARIRPAQKVRIVERLKADGEVVAMTGDGVNDAPAIKAAHIGIAMGGRGTDVAREASAIVLLDDDFGSIVHTIRLGRRIYDNLRKAIEYIVAVHIPIAGLALLPLVLGLPLVFGPAHIAFLEMIIDPACSIILEAEREEEDVMERPPRDPASPLLVRRRVLWAVTQGLVALAILATLYLSAAHLGMAEEDLRALVFTSLVLFSVGLILVNRSFDSSLASAFLRPNPALRLLLGGVVALLALILFWPPARALFHFGRLHWDDLAACATAGLLGLLLLERLKSRWFGLGDRGRRRVATRAGPRPGSRVSR